MSLWASLQEVELFPVASELEVHRCAIRFFHRLQDLAHQAGKPTGEEAVEGNDERGWGCVDSFCDRPLQHAVLFDRNDLLDTGKGPVEFEIGDGDSLETVLIQVDHIDEALGVPANVPGGHFRPHTGCAERNHAGEVVPHTIDDAGAETECDPHQAVLAFDPRAPPPLIPRNGDAGPGGEKVVVVTEPDHLLDQDRHLFVVIDQVPLLPVEDRVGAERGGVHLGDRAEKIVQTVFQVALVAEKD